MLTPTVVLRSAAAYWLTPPVDPTAPVRLPGKECSHQTFVGHCGSCQRWDKQRRKQMSAQAKAAAAEWERAHRV